jgi:hypothetical protein
MATPGGNLLKAIDENDLGAVKACVRAAPETLKEVLTWETGHGYALNYAARQNRPEIIEYLVKDCGQDVNRHDGVIGGWTPLHHAEYGKSVAAAGVLLGLGADPAIKDEKDRDTKGFCTTREVLALTDPNYLETQRQLEQQLIEKKAAGTWTRTGPREVVHDYELSDSRCRLTDVFNFETRCWRAIAKDLERGGMTQSVVPFDSLADPAPLLPALEKLKELGGENGEDALAGSTRLNKPSLPRLG